MRHRGQSGGAVPVTRRRKLSPVPGGGKRGLWPWSASLPGRWQGFITRWRHKRPGTRDTRGGDQPPVIGGAGPILKLLLPPGLGQRVKSQESGADSKEVISPGDQSVHRVLQAQVLFFQLVKGRQKGGDIKVTGLFHEEPAALLPVPLQELLQSLGLTSRVQHSRHGVRRTPATVMSLASAGQRDTNQLSRVIHRVNRMGGNLVLKSDFMRKTRRKGPY